MPTYDFQCEQCQQHFSKNVAIGTTETPCSCGKTARKVFSATAIHFSGKGFYATDSKQHHSITKKNSEK